jgi:hypothetical protein
MLHEDLTLIIPAYNEEASIGKVLEEAESLDCKVVVGDNHSTDGTSKICESKGITPTMVSRLGKGNVIRALIEKVDTPYTVMVNADYTYPLIHVLTLRGLLWRNVADVVIGVRSLKIPGSMSGPNTLGNWTLSLIASALYKSKVSDVCSGMWGFKTTTLRSLGLCSEGFTLEAEMFVKSIRSNCRIAQVPIAYYPRLDGSKAKLKLSHGLEIAYYLVRSRFD